MKAEARARLYKSIADLQTHLLEGKKVSSDRYSSLCLQLNYFFLNLEKDNPALSLDETELKAVRELSSILDENWMDRPRMNEAIYNHAFFYFYLLDSWLHFMQGDFDEAEELIDIAKSFPKRVMSAETDHLEILVDGQIELQKTLQQSITRQPKHVAEEPILSPEQFQKVVEKYQANKAELLLKASDETLARYFIDPKHQAESVNPMDLWNKREPGSVSAMTTLIRTMFAKDSELSLGFLKEMHRLALNGVTLPKANRRLPVIPGEFRREAVQFNMFVSRASSPLGLYDVMDWIEKQNLKRIDGYERYKLKPLNAFNGINLEICTQPEEIETSLLELIKDYHVNIANSSSTRDVIKACATFSHHFSLIHPFSDGNLRLSQQLLNFLLAKNNLPLCILSEPALIEGLSPDELVDQILIGFHNFQHLVEKGYVPNTNIEYNSEEVKTTSPNSLSGSSFFQQQVTEQVNIDNDPVAKKIKLTKS